MRFSIPRKTLAMFSGVAVLLVATAAVADAPLKIGLIWTYSTNDPTTQAFDAGIQTYMKMHGDSVAGRQVEIIKRDDGGINPDLAKRHAQELIVSENVDAIGGFVWTANATAAGTVALAAKKPEFVANATALGYLDKFPNMSRYAFTIYELGQVMGRYAAAHGIKRVFSIYFNIQSGIDAAKGFEETFTAAGGKVLGTDAVPMGSKEFTPYLQRVKDAKPDAIWLWMPATSGAPQFLQTFHTLGLDRDGVKILATGDLVEENNLKAEGDAAIGVISTYTYSQWHNSALNREFVKQFKLIAPNIEPNFTAVEAYDMMQGIYAVAQAQKGGFDYDKAMETIKTLKWESPRGPVAMDPLTRDLIQNVYVRRTEKVNGKLQNTEFETAPMIKNP
jgi:branched-chain amino acid transport system substrate-binding protein